MRAKFCRPPAAFRAWLQRHHGSAVEVPVGFYKGGAGTPSITWPEAVDEALCYGWIDGVRKRVDEQSYTIRFAPRRAGSICSAVNTRRAATWWVLSARTDATRLRRARTLVALSAQLQLIP